MAAFEEDLILGAPKPKSAQHAIGQNVDDLSAPELSERIEVCRREIARLEAAIVAREATKQAASAIFSSGKA